MNKLVCILTQVCISNNVGLVPLILLGWELRGSYVTVLCVQAILILSPLLFYAIPIYSTFLHLLVDCFVYDFNALVNGVCSLYSPLWCLEVASEWTEETVNLCLQLFVFLLPLNHKLLKE